MLPFNLTSPISVFHFLALPDAPVDTLRICCLWSGRAAKQAEINSNTTLIDYIEIVSNAE